MDVLGTPQSAPRSHVAVQVDRIATSCAAGEPVRLEHEYVRKGALNLFAAFDTRTGDHGES
jgi:hypothetical protein